MTGQISFRTGDVAEAFRFLRENYDSTRSLEQWSWEYKGNRSELVVFSVIDDDGNIGGVQPMNPVYIHLEGQSLLSGRSETSVVDPSLRGKKYWIELYSHALSVCAMKDMRFVWGITLAGVAKKLRDNLGFTVHTGIFRQSIYIMNPKNAMENPHNSQRSFITRLVFYVAAIALFLYCNIFASVLRRLVNPRNKRENSTITDKLYNMSDMKLLYSRIREKYPGLVHIDQDEQYMNWRIYDNPNVICKTYFLYQGDLLTGYCYVAISGKRSSIITDLTFDRDADGKVLLAKVMADLRKADIFDIRFWGNCLSPLVARSFTLLRLSGFISRPSPSFIIFKNISLKDSSVFDDIHKWHINGLWSEGYADL